MIVFFPFYRPKNNFLDELESYFDGTFIFDSYTNFHLYKNIDIIHIHWPEALFDWERINSSKFEDFIACFNSWTKKYKIVYTRHNVYPHSNTSNYYRELYDFISVKADVVIHMGNYSIKEFKTCYPKSDNIQKLIEHPLYLKKTNTISKQEARAYFGLNDEQKVILVFGQIRNNEERKMVMSAFRKLNIKNKVLLANRMKKFKLPAFLGTRFNYSYNKLMFKMYNSKSCYILKSKFVEEDFVQYYFKAADVILIPRMTLLNSGNLYLACTFNKNIVAPLIGNVSEKLEYLDADGFYPNDINSLVNALKLSLRKKGLSNNYKNGLKTMDPKVVANKHMELYKTLSQ